MTYSIVARDPERGELGIAVQSKFLSVGAVVPWAKAGVGAIATQALANTSYGIQGLKHLAAGRSAQETLEQLLAGDEGRADRQVGIIGMAGQPVSFTGERCFHWAGGLTGEHYACQGNILVSGDTVEAMARTFEETGGLLCDRLLAALAAGQAAGGDGRGQQSAALLVVKEGAGYGGYTDRFIDLRVDDHPTPIDELKRILELHKLYLFRPDPADILTIDASLAQELQKLLTITGDYQSSITSRYDETTREAFRAFSGRENLEERWFEDARIDRVVLAFLRQKVADHKAH
ncbi:DUF1028 domain-containing protein [Ktedonobacter robiniae]|uniref:Putative peptidoglycan binding domain-containing protein n=1 Tax=Ktedonobacter robiniae TaxID=2778365 RepID=A0ABQ3UJ56_9CHLR|nr:DUF1028 domain-containing protein [Ktedonobacter robiniae]GHO52753.1 hypothetical protein KSB_12280 [Ktedonobacter robiniae]